MPPVWERLMQSSRFLVGITLTFLLILVMTFSPSSRSASLELLQGAENRFGGSRTPLTSSHAEDVDISMYDDKTQYELMVLISTPKVAIQHRATLRKILFNLKDTIHPCMRQNGQVYYKFVVNKGEVLDGVTERAYQIERLEWDDILELTTANKWQPPPRENRFGPQGHNTLAGLYSTSLRWVQSQRLATETPPKGESMDSDFPVIARYVLLTNVYSLPNVNEILADLTSSDGAAPGDSTKLDLVAEQLEWLVWGHVELPLTDRDTFVLGARAVEAMLATGPTDQFKLQEQNMNLIFRQAPDRFLQYYNNPESIKDLVDSGNYPLAINGVYLDQDLEALAEIMQLQHVRICTPYIRPQTRIAGSMDSPPMIDPEDLEPASIAVVTSSYIYPDNCMLEAAYAAMRNKRKYAQSHGYTFVSRSREFMYQESTIGRKAVWGKIDTIQKVLPHFEWILWMDMDALVVDSKFLIQDMIANFGNVFVADKKKWAETSLIVTRPVGDIMLNAGVFLIRNTPWAFRFLEAVSDNRETWKSKGYEQNSMAQLITRPEWANHTLYISPDDRLLGTLNTRFQPGDPIIHYAPDGCPAQPIIENARIIANEQLPSTGKIATGDRNHPDKASDDAAGAVPGLGFSREGWIGLDKDERIGSARG